MAMTRLGTGADITALLTLIPMAVFIVDFLIIVGKKFLPREATKRSRPTAVYQRPAWTGHLQGKAQSGFRGVVGSQSI